MSEKVKGLLQKINLIETDMDLHKQILVSIPSDNKAEIETVIKKIADQKKQIGDLRLEIKNTDEDEYNKIIAIEKAAQTFRQISKDKKFILVNTLNETGECYITFNDGTRIDCLVAAKEENGNWTVLTLEGETKEYPGGLVK
ncbi:MAG: hypothetical protein GY699_06235 [Desulfobacteraceae bacterium]|nr:hypothetical protein [Desulfobacteraceae bacterium]